MINGFVVVWLLVVQVGPVGRVVVPDIVTRTECDRLGNVFTYPTDREDYHCVSYRRAK